MIVSLYGFKFSCIFKFTWLNACGLPSFDDNGTDLVVGFCVGIYAFCRASGGMKFFVASSGTMDLWIKS